MFVLVTLLLVCCAGIWAGARCWLLLVPRQLHRSAAETLSTQGQVRQNREHLLFIFLLLLLLLANSIAPLVQAISLTAFWFMTEIAIVAALLLEIAGVGWIGGITTKLAFRRRPLSRSLYIALPFVGSLLALITFLAILLPGYLFGSNGNAGIAVLLARVQLLIIGMTTGGILAFAFIYLPAMHQLMSVEKARSVLEIAPYYSQIIVTGEILTVLTVLIEILQARNFSTSFVSSTTISYSLILALETTLPGMLLVISAIYLRIAYPQLRKALGKYKYISQRVKATGVMQGNLLEQFKQRETRLLVRTQFLRTIARYEAATGIGLLLVASLSYVVLSTAMLPVAITQKPGIQKPSSQFTATTMTTDNQFKLTLTISPNHYGPNTFTVNIAENRTGSPATIVDVSLSLTMVDMNMGTNILRLHATSPNRYSGLGNLSMTGNWLIRVLLRTQDNRVHEAQVKLLTPY